MRISFSTHRAKAQRKPGYLVTVTVVSARVMANRSDHLRGSPEASGANCHLRAASTASLPKKREPPGAAAASVTSPEALTVTRTTTVAVPLMVLRAAAGISGRTWITASDDVLEEDVLEEDAVLEGFDFGCSRGGGAAGVGCGAGA